MADMCIRATPTSTCVGQKVVLDGLKKLEYNGMEGTLGGYIADLDRRVFHPLNDPMKEMSVKPENIYLLSEEGGGTKKICTSDDALRAGNLVDTQDRLGSISLHEVVMSTRDDVARLLLERSETCLDVPYLGDLTVRRMALVPIQGAHPVNDVIRTHVRKATRKQERKMRAREICENCGKKAHDLGKELMVCMKCLDVVYCSRVCQLSDWSSKHKKECAERERRLGLELGQVTPVPYSNGSVHHRTQMKVTEFYCRAPLDVKPNEKFWVKVQSNGIDEPLLIYDQTRYAALLNARLASDTAR
jgi:MYND finger